MGNSGVAWGGGESTSGAKGPGFFRWVCILVAGILGSVAGGLLTIPLWVIIPYWVFLTLPHFFGAVFASSMAYLVAGPAKVALLRVMSCTLAAAAGIGLINLPLFLGIVPGVNVYDDLALPGGVLTHLLEAVMLGLAAGVLSTRGEPARWAKRIALVLALFLSAIAIAALLFIGLVLLERPSNT